MATWTHGCARSQASWACCSPARPTPNSSGGWKSCPERPGPSTTGSEYDRAFAQRLREAHGAVLPVIAQVRAGTRNELMRTFAVEADVYVSRHIQYLESTGLVDYAALPEPPSPGLFSAERGQGDLVVPALVFTAALLAAAGIVSAVRKRDAGLRGAVRDTVARRAPLPLIALPAPRLPEPGPRHAIRR